MTISNATSPSPPSVSARRPPAATRRRGILRGPRGLLVGLLLAIGLVAVAAGASLVLGSKAIPLPVALNAIFHYDPSVLDQTVVHSLRFPRTLLGLMVGVALGLAGTVMQGVSRNPLADPGILGVNSGAALAVLVGVQFFGATTLLGYVWFAFVGAAVAVVVVYVVASIGRDGATPIKLALAGTAVTALLTSLTTVVQLMDVRTGDAFRSWMVGSLAGRGGDIVAELWPFVVVGGILALGTGRVLNGLALGDDVARALGQNVTRSRLFCGVVVVLLAGAATAAAGPIVFLGLTVPHIARAIVGPDYRWILPFSAVLSPLLFLVADIIGRLVLAPAELQVGIVTAVLGAPVFIAIVRRKNVATL